MKNFGFAGYDNVIYIGTNGKMDEVSAAMGLTLFESLDEIIETNTRNYHLYRKGLSGLPGITLLPYDEKEKCNYQYVVLIIDEKKLGLSRDQVIKILHAENILARRYFYPGCHRMEPYRSYFPQAGLLLPQTERLASQLLSLPTGSAVTEKDIDTICEIIKLALQHASQIQEKLNRE
jgi:dTDP-4-amino-4,6-dideoxygalactose transaminase